METVSKKKKKGEKEVVKEKGRKRRGRSKIDLDEPVECPEEKSEPQPDFIPVRGQKAAWKRLNQMRGLFIAIDCFMFSLN